MKLFLISISLFFIFKISAQTKEQRQEITSKIDAKESTAIQIYLAEEYQSTEERVANYMKDHPIISRTSIIDGKTYFLKDVIDNTPIYLTTDNRNSSRTINTNEMYANGSLGINIEGQGMTVGVWDQDIALTTHEALTGKITSFDGTTTVGDHATHVTGTVVANGVAQLLARGIAFQGVSLNSDWNNDHSEMLSFGGQGYLVSNHSYGYNAATIPLWYFGAYNSDSRSVDLICNIRPYYSIVYAAGNDRDNFSAYNPSKNGYDLITGDSQAKNAITVGAVNQVLTYTSPSSVVMSSFSNWGPSDDGRIKPDVVAKGVAVYSPTAASNSSYSSYNGTSMAAPAIAGMVLLLQQYYNSLNANFMKAASVKGLILHSTREAGSYAGPDYRFGWGLPDAVAASNIITEDGNNTLIEERNLLSGVAYTVDVAAVGTEPLKVSISWTDPAGTANNGVVDDPTPALVNDLDVKVEQGGITYHPWKLNVSSPVSAATNTSTNDVDNFERVDIDNPSGTYTITVSNKGTLSSGSQDYTLIVSGGSVLGVEDVESQSSTFEIYPNPVAQVLTVKSADALEGAKASVFNTNGQMVIQTNLSSNNQLAVDQLTSGNYVLVIDHNGQKLVKKFIKK